MCVISITLNGIEYKKQLNKNTLIVTYPCIPDTFNKTEPGSVKGAIDEDITFSYPKSRSRLDKAKRWQGYG